MSVAIPPVARVCRRSECKNYALCLFGDAVDHNHTFVPKWEKGVLWMCLSHERRDHVAVDVG